jgi:hypothetical protein
MEIETDWSRSIVERSGIVGLRPMGVGAKLERSMDRHRFRRLGK